MSDILAQKNETSKHHDLAAKRRKSHFRELEFQNFFWVGMPPDPPTGGSPNIDPPSVKSWIRPRSLMCLL